MLIKKLIECISGIDLRLNKIWCSKKRKERTKEKRKTS